MTLLLGLAIAQESFELVGLGGSLADPVEHVEGRLVLAGELENSWLLYGLRYRRGSVGEDEQVSTQVDLTWARPIGDRGWFLVEGTPGWFFAGEGFHPRQLRFEGGVLAARQWEHLALGAGLFYSTAFGKPLPFPVIFVAWTGERLRIETVPPLEATIELRATDIVRVVGTSRFQGATHVDGGGTAHVLEELRVGGGLVVAVAPHLDASLHGGRALARSWEEETLPDSWFVTGRLSVVARDPGQD